MFLSWWLSDGILWDVTVASSPPSLESFFSWESLSSQLKSYLGIPFDMHSFHNLIASFSKGLHECGLDICPMLRVFLQSDILRLKGELPLIPNHSCLEHLCANFLLQKESSSLQLKGNMPSHCKKQTSQRDSRRSWGRWLSDRG